MKRVQTLVAGVVCLCLLATAPATADVVTDWNGIARDPAYSTPRAGPSSIIDLAMMHAAMHDAIQTIQGRFQTYSGLLPASQGSEVAAAAVAAHRILVNRYPTREEALNARLLAYLGVCDQACVDGQFVGIAAANAIILLRQNDGAFPSPAPSFMGGTNPGEWRPTSFNPDGSAQPMVASWLGDVHPFTTATAQFEAKPPPRMTSREYARDYNEVKLLGRAADAAHPSARTPEQEASATFFREPGQSYWSRTLPAIVDAHVTDTGDRARLYALLHLSMADALITSWHSKKFYNFWRPQTAIQLGDFDSNPDTVADPGWVPHTVTPNYPDYTSGANNIGGAVASDVVDARILEGIHFRFADTAARTQGRNVAKWVFKHFLQPVDGAPVADDDEEDEQ